MSQEPNRPAGGPEAEPAPAHSPSQMDRFREKIMTEYDRLGPDDAFRFACHPGVPCFNACCSDVNIFLTPYDVLRLKNAVGLESGEFLDRYTQIPIAEKQRYPIVMLKMQSNETKTCPFVGPEGCSVYGDRPWPCRMYPVGLASPKDKDARDFWFLMCEDVCKGFAEDRAWTVREWLDDQGIARWDEFGQLFKELTLHDWWLKGKPLPPEKIEMFYTALYDLDRFRRFVFDSTFLRRFEVEPEKVEAMRQSDEELLRFAHRWLRFALFGDKTIEVRPEALGPRSGPRG